MEWSERTSDTRARKCAGTSAYVFGMVIAKMEKEAQAMDVTIPLTRVGANGWLAQAGARGASLGGWDGDHTHARARGRRRRHPLGSSPLALIETRRRRHNEARRGGGGGASDDARRTQDTSVHAPTHAHTLTYTHTHRHTPAQCDMSPRPRSVAPVPAPAPASAPCRPLARSLARSPAARLPLRRRMSISEIGLFLCLEEHASRRAAARCLPPPARRLHGRPEGNSILARAGSQGPPAANKAATGRMYD